MVGILFSLLVFMALLSIVGEFIMRIRLSQRRAPGKKLAWWRRGGDAVSSAYGELFPNSHIPSYRRFAFWLVVVCTASILGAVLWKAH